MVKVLQQKIRGKSFTIPKASKQPLTNKLLSLGKVHNPEGTGLPKLALGTSHLTDMATTTPKSRTTTLATKNHFTIAFAQRAIESVFATF